MQTGKKTDDTVSRRTERKSASGSVFLLWLESVKQTVTSCAGISTFSLASLLLTKIVLKLSISGEGNR